MEKNLNANQGQFNLSCFIGVIRVDLKKFKN
jgi:hypothetical protein